MGGHEGAGPRISTHEKVILERSHRIIDGWGEGVVIREPMGKDRGEITVGQMGRGSTQGRGEPQGKQ